MRYIGCAAALAILAQAADARAGGLQLPTRGVRPTARQ